MSATAPFTVLYDATCPVCALEMDHLQARNAEGRLRLVDISQPGFDPAPYGATLQQLDAEIHGVRADGSVIRGMEVLRLAYDAVGLGWVLRATGVGPLKPVFDLGYRLFARYRHPISRTLGPVILAARAWRARRVAAAAARCTAGACATGAAGKTGDAPRDSA